MSNPVSTVWRNDGVINFVVTPSVMVNTFMAMVPNHTSWSCWVMEDMAAAVQKSDVEAVMPEVANLFDTFVESIAKSHKSEVGGGNRIRLGTPDEFEGMYYGTMHPSELFAISQDAGLYRDALGGLTKSAPEGAKEALADAFAAFDFWIEAAKRYVRPAEQIGPYSVVGYGSA